MTSLAAACRSLAPSMRIGADTAASWPPILGDRWNTAYSGRSKSSRMAATPSRFPRRSAGRCWPRCSLEANRPAQPARLSEALWGDERTTSRRSVAPGARLAPAARARPRPGRDTARRLPRPNHGRRTRRSMLRGRARRSATRAADAARWLEAADGFRRALALWRGAALADVPCSGYLEPEAARLEELRLTAIEGRIDADLELGRHERR